MSKNSNFEKPLILEQFWKLWMSKNSNFEKPLNVEQFWKF